MERHFQRDIGFPGVFKSDGVLGHRPGRVGSLERRSSLAESDSHGHDDGDGFFIAGGGKLCG